MDSLNREEDPVSERFPDSQPDRRAHREYASRVARSVAALSQTRGLLGGAIVAPLIALALFAWLNGGLGDSQSKPVAFAAAGDFQLDFVAAENTTYYQRGPNEGKQIGAAEGQNLAFDDRTINTDVVEQLEAEDFQCNDRIIFFTEIVVDDPPAGEYYQDIFLEFDFDAENNGQQGV